MRSETSHLSNDDDPDLSEFISQRKISLKCSEVIESVLDKFSKHLCGVERGSKPLESAKQICTEVRRAFFVYMQKELTIYLRSTASEISI